MKKKKILKICLVLLMCCLLVTTLVVPVSATHNLSVQGRTANYLKWTLTTYYNGVSNEGMPVITSRPYNKNYANRLETNATIQGQAINGIEYAVTSRVDVTPTQDYDSLYTHIALYNNDMVQSYGRVNLEFEPFIFYPPNSVDVEMADVIPSISLTEQDSSFLDPTSLGEIQCGLTYSYYDKDGNFVTNTLADVTNIPSYHSPILMDGVKSMYLYMLEDVSENSQSDAPCKVDEFIVNITKLPQSSGNHGYYVTGVGITEYYFYEQDRVMLSQDIRDNPIRYRYESIDTDFTSWIGTAVNGIWNFQIFPYITIGTITLSLIGMSLLIVFLKKFAGG